MYVLVGKPFTVTIEVTAISVSSSNVAVVKCLPEHDLNILLLANLQSPVVYNPSGEFKIIAVDCGIKYNQIRCLIARGAAVKVVPWNYDFNNDVEKGGDQS